MTRFVLAFCLVRRQWSGKVYLGVHYADVRAPEWTGQASGTQVGGVGAREGSACASADSRVADIGVVTLPPWLAGCQCNKLWPLRYTAGPRDPRVPSANLELSGDVFETCSLLVMFRKLCGLLERILKVQDKQGEDFVKMKWCTVKT